MSAHRRAAPRESVSYTASSTTPRVAPDPAFAAGPVLLAVDRTARGEASAQAAHDLATRRAARVEVVTVFDTRPQLIPPPLDLAIALEEGAAADSIRAEQRGEVSALLAAALGRTVEWPIEIRLGTPAPTIVDEAERVGASLIVLGLHPQRAIDRALTQGTALGVMRQATCPVLAVTPSALVPPRRVLVGADFGNASLRAARVALALLADGGTLVLAYVPPGMPDLPDDGERVVHELGVEAAWKWFEGELRAPSGVTIEHVVLPRAPRSTVAYVLCRHADDTGVDLIALGSRQHGRIERWLLGSVTTDIARDGAYALLVAPPEDA